MYSPNLAALYNDNCRLLLLLLLLSLLFGSDARVIRAMYVRLGPLGVQLY